MGDKNEYVFMTLKTLQDLRQRGEAETVKEQLTRALEPGEIRRFAHYHGKRVITVHRGMMPDGEIWTEPTPEIMGWLTNTHKTAQFVQEIEAATA